MKKYITFILFLSHSYTLFSQITNIIPASTSIAQTSVADAHSWTSFNNPAMLGNLAQTELGIQLDNRYLLKELSTKSLQLAFATNSINSGLSFSYFGYSLYHEMMAGLSLARNFSDKFSIGVQFNYLTTYFTASNTYKGTLFPQVGLSVQLSPAFNIGFQTFNPFHYNIQTEYVLKRIPSVFSLGTAYNFSNEFVWRTQMDKEISSNYRFATGFDYQMLAFVKVKLGAYCADYLVPCLGLGFNTGKVMTDFNCELHPLLGLNTMASLKYRFGK